MSYKIDCNFYMTFTLPLYRMTEITYVCNQYKTYAGLKYHVNFPNHWILNELPGTGRECMNCVGNELHRTGYAMWRGIVLGYCTNCAIYEYKGDRGAGFYGYGVEFNPS